MEDQQSKDEPGSNGEMSEEKRQRHEKANAAEGGGAGGPTAKADAGEGAKSRVGGDSQSGASGFPDAESPEEEPGLMDGVKTWIGDVFAQASEVILRPGEFFDGLPREGGSGQATGFAIVMGFVAGVLGFVLGELPGFQAVFTTPFAAFAATVVGAFLVHALAMVANGRGTLEASYRLAGYMMAFLPLIVVAGVLPYLNIAMASYALYALILGAISVHGIEERRAWSVFGAVGGVLLAVALVGKLWSQDSRSALQELRDYQRQTADRLEKRIEGLNKRAK